MSFNVGSIYAEARLDNRKWLSGLNAISKGTKATMVIVSAAFVKSVYDANKFEKALSNVSTVVDTTKISMPKLSASIQNLAPSLGNTTELTKGLYQAFSAGASSAKDAMDITVASAKFAKAGLTSTADSVDVITTAVNAYGSETVSAEKASDILFNTIKLGKVTGAELAASLGDSIPIYASVGVSLEELTSGLASMTKVGVKSSIATTQLNGIVNAFIKPSQAMTAQLEKQGYESGEALLRSEGLSGALNFLQKATGGQTKELATLVPNINALKGVTALARDGAREFKDTLIKQADATGASNEAFQKQEKTFDTYKNSLAKTSIYIGSIGKSFIDKIAVGATTANEKMLDFLKSSKGIGKISKIIGALGGVFAGLTKVIKTIFIDAITRVTKTFKDIGDETGKSFEPMKLFTYGLLIIQSVGKTLVSAFIIVIDTIKFFIDLIKNAGETFSLFKDIITGKISFSEFKASLKENFASFGDLTREFASDTTDVVKGEIENYKNLFAQFGSGLTDGTNDLYNNVKEGTQSTSDFVGSVLDNSSLKNAEALDSLNSAVADANAENLENTILTNDQIVEDTEETTDEVKTTWQTAYNSIKDAVSSTISSLQNIFRDDSRNKLIVIKNQYKKEKKALDDDLKNKKITRDQYDQQLEAANANMRKKENDEKRKAFNANKAFSIVNAIMAGAQAVIGWWASAPLLGPIAGPIFAAIMTGVTAGVTAAQIGLIATQQFTPSYALGGMASGTVRVNEEGGEIIKLPDNSLVIPNDISKQIAQDSGKEQSIIVNNYFELVQGEIDIDELTGQIKETLTRELKQA